MATKKQPSKTATAKKQTFREPKAPAKGTPARKTAPRDYEHARVGQFVDVIAGEYDGLYGAYEREEEHGLAFIRNRDHGNDFPAYVTVRKQDIRPSARTGGR